MDSQNNLARAFLENKWIPYFFPGLLYIVCWKLQIYATLAAGMLIPGGYNLVVLTQGVRLSTFYLFGFRAVIGLTLMSAPYFYFFPEVNDTQGFWGHEIQNIVYSLAVYLTLEIVRRFKKLDAEFNGISGSDMLWVIVISAVVCSCIKTQFVPYIGELSLLSLLTYQVLGRIVGSLLVLYVIMLSLAIMQRVNIDASAT